MITLLCECVEFLIETTVVLAALIAGLGLDEY
jgi:hypothetical protein